MTDTKLYHIFSQKHSDKGGPYRQETGDPLPKAEAYQFLQLIWSTGRRAKLVPAPLAAAA
ncbi:hypothetical protein [Methylobacterium ajmalii]|uniref:hypothetical protein n=1 Tax=Methylobacterium ajmalii TaxID=2738439 RepID=UPI002F35A2D4